MQRNHVDRALGGCQAEPAQAPRSGWGPLPALLRLALLGLAWLALAPATAYAQNCGGPGQRACCLGEADFGACRDGVTEINGCSGIVADCDCRDKNGNVGAFDSNSHCKQAPACGGAGQRACCIGEQGFGACKDGVTEVNGCSGGEASCLCGGDANPLSIQSNSHCQQATPCGGEGQRACCVGEAAACQAGLAEVPVCNGDCFCGGDANPFSINASGTCIKPTPCGGKGQRACIVGERSGGNCDPGLVQVPRCVGDCFGKGAGSSFGVSSGMCAAPEIIQEPTTARTQPAHDAPTTASSTCPLYGYMDMHLHLFADLAHGGGVLAGTPYDKAGGINVALQQCEGSNRDFVNQDLKTGAETSVEAPGLPCPTDFYPGGCGTKIFHGGHDIFNDAVGSPVATRDGALEGLFGESSNLGAPIFNGWPRWTSTTHQQSYHKWLERAWQGGLRLITMLAVTNEALCKGGKHLKGTNCEDSMDSIDKQIKEAKKFETFIDEQYGTNDENKGWFRIVTTPADGRKAIAAGQMAVVLGVETAELFNCKFAIDQCTITDSGATRTVKCPGTDGFKASGPLTTPFKIMNTDGTETEITMCTPEFINNRVQQLHDKGISHVFPIHNFDNGFGGAATWQDAIEVGNRAVEKHWWFPEACPADPLDYGFKLGDFSQFALSLIKFFFPGVITETPDRLLATDPPSCNQYGLFPLGQTLITELMNKGMLIDVDHMSRKAFDKTLSMAEARKYPGIVASHVLSFDRHDQEVRHERMRTKTQLERIKNVGGMIAAMLKDEVLDNDKRGDKHQLDYDKSSVANDCRHSSKSFAQAFEYAVDVMGGPVAMGSDFNGVAGHFGPRFGSDACGGITDHMDPAGRDSERSAQLRANNRLQYPFTLSGFGAFDKQSTGQRTFDYNVDGMAHVGLLPDFVADLKNIGMADSDLNMLFRSAEAYIKVWEGARKVGLGEQPAADAPACVSVTGSYSPSPVYDNSVVFFSAQATPPGAAVSWNFGDSSTGSGASAAHQYAASGTYTVAVRATDPFDGRSAEDTLSVPVEAWPFPAQVLFTAPNETYEGDSVDIGFRFDASRKYDSAACGGGVAPQSVEVSVGSISKPTEGKMVCKYPGGLPASVDIAVTVLFKRTDRMGNEIEAPFTHKRPIGILNRPPSFTGASDASITFGSSLTLALNLNDVAGDPLRLTVDWGDGSAPESFSNLAAGLRNVAHFYSNPSTVGKPYAVAISLSDEAATATHTINVEVVGPPPFLDLSGPDHSSVARVERYDFFGNDPDGGTVGLSQISCGPAGEFAGGPAVGPVDAGRVYFLFCRFTSASASNPVSVTYTDDEGRKTAATRLVRIGSPPLSLLAPRASLSAAEGTSLPFFVQGYTTDGDDVKLRSIACGSEAPVSQSGDNFGGTNVNLDVDFTCRFKEGPATVTVSATVTDIDGDTTQTLAVTVNNVAPSITLLQGPGRLVPGQSSGVVIRATDPGPDPITATITWGDGTSSSVPFLGGAPGVVVQAAAPHTWQRPGNYTVTVAVADDDGGQSQQTFQVVVVDNTPPVVTVPDPITREATSALGAAVSFSATANDDVDGALVPSCTPVSGSTFPLGPATTVTCSATDAAGNTGSASFTVRVVDTTPPEITVSVSPEPNGAGWHKDPATIDWTLHDVVGVSDSTGCDDVTLTGETTGTLLTCTAKDAAGNTTSKSVTVKLDRTAPAILFGAATPDANANGWHMSDVSLPFTISDGGSGLPAGAASSGTLTFSTEGAGLTQSVAAVDVAGNETTAASPAINIDKTAPAITCAAADGFWHPADVSIGCTTTDGGAGLANPTDAAFSLTTAVPAGTETADAFTDSRNVCDVAGNCATASAIGGNKVDKKAPALVCAAPDGLWHATDQRIGCTAADGGAGLANPADAAFSLTTAVPAGTETANASTNSHVVCDLTGNCATASPIAGNRIDKKAPDIVATRTPDPNVNGWNNTDVVATFVAADGGSGVAGLSTTTVLFTGEGANQSATRAFSDNVGNTSSASIGNINIDKTMPAGYNQFDPITKTVQVFGRDALSGVAKGPIEPLSVERVHWHDGDGGDVGEDRDGDDDGDDDDCGEKKPKLNAELRTYRITDLAGNSFLLVERVKQAGKETKVEVVSFQYDGQPVVKAPKNSKRFEWSVNKNGSLRELEQKMTVGRGRTKSEVVAHFDAKKNRTQIIDKRDPRRRGEHDDDDDHKKIVRPGLALLRLAVAAGTLVIEYDPAGVLL